MRITKTTDITEGLFFPEDFTKLPKDTIIYIHKGKLINFKINEKDNENEKPKPKRRRKNRNGF